MFFFNHNLFYTSRFFHCIAVIKIQIAMMRKAKTRLKIRIPFKVTSYTSKYLNGDNKSRKRIPEYCDVIARKYEVSKKTVPTCTAALYFFTMLEINKPTKKNMSCVRYNPIVVVSAAAGCSKPPVGRISST